MQLTKNTNGNYTPRQLKLPLEIEKLIDIFAPVFTLCEVMDHIDPSRYFVKKGYKTRVLGTEKVYNKDNIRNYKDILND